MWGRKTGNSGTKECDQSPDILDLRHRDWEKSSEQISLSSWNLQKQILCAEIELDEWQWQQAAADNYTDTSCFGSERSGADGLLFCQEVLFATDAERLTMETLCIWKKMLMVLMLNFVLNCIMLEMCLYRADTEQIQLDSMIIITLSHYYWNKSFGDTSGCLTWGDRNDFGQRHKDIHPTLKGL